MSTKFCIAMLLLCGCLLTCGSQKAWTSQDSWYTGPPDGDEPYWSWQELDRPRIFEIVVGEQAEAERLLQDVSIVALSEQQAAQLTRQTLPHVPGTQPYLVRGVYLNRDTGNVSVYVSDSRLAIHHGSLGSSAVPMKRQALVLQLEHPPEEVSVICSMSQ